MENKVDDGCILAVEAARDVIGDYCGVNCPEITDIFSMFVAAISVPGSMFAITSNEKLSIDERVAQLIEHKAVMSSVGPFMSWDREKTTQLFAILLVFITEARISKESATNAPKK